MNKYFLVFSLLLSLEALASGTKEITCSFESLHPSATLTIAVDNMEDPLEITSAQVYTNYNGESTAVTFSGERDLEWLYLLVGSRDSSFFPDENENIVYELASDGCDVGVFKLYRNNEFKYGYLKIEDRCSGKEIPDTYSKAKCRVSKFSH